MNQSHDATGGQTAKHVASVTSLLTGVGAVFGASATTGTRLGIGMHSYGHAWKSARDGKAGVGFRGALSFLEYAHSIGAAGVQVTIRLDDREDVSRIRARAEELGVYFESQLSIPRDKADTARFEDELKTLRAAGATVARTAVLGTRRYETLKSAAEFREFKERGTRSLALAEPILKRHGVRLAVENHKDWLAPELADLLRKMSSEWVGACVDTGNSLALLEDPDAVVEALAPFAVTTHIKDMAVREYADGFLLSEVSIGDGFLDLPRMIALMRKARPGIALNLEMITRDPLQIPCLKPEYWATLGEMKGGQLAEALARVKQNASLKPLPRTTGLLPAQLVGLEDDHVRECLKWGTENLAQQI